MSSGKVHCNSSTGAFTGGNDYPIVALAADAAGVWAILVDDNGDVARVSVNTPTFAVVELFAPDRLV